MLLSRHERRYLQCDLPRVICRCSRRQLDLLRQPRQSLCSIWTARIEKKTITTTAATMQTRFNIIIVTPFFVTHTS
jgi:hypothetical protein